MQENRMRGCMGLATYERVISVSWFEYCKGKCEHDESGERFHYELPITTNKERQPCEPHSFPINLICTTYPNGKGKEFHEINHPRLPMDHHNSHLSCTRI